MAKKETRTNAMRMLDKAGIAYTPNTYECEEFIDAVEISKRLNQPFHTVFKTLVTVGKSGQHYVCVIPIDQELDLKKAARAVGEKSLEMIHVKELLPLTGYIRGGCTPIGMKKPFPTLLHLSARELPQMIISGGRIGLQLILAPEDLRRVTDARWEDLTV